ncbi:MAG: Rieske (2Fe-2S) protein [Pseudomonadota bacterium]
MAEERRSNASVNKHPAPRNRRDFLAAGRGLLFGAAISVSDEAEAAKPPEKLPTQPGDRIQIIKGDLKNQFVKPEMLETGARPIEAFPFDMENEVIRRKNRLNRLLVVRLDPAEMDEETLGRSTEGVLVFSALCTHRSCTIKSWKEEERVLRCHCHLSEFDALSGGSVLSGPARRQLPMVPLGLDDQGFVVALDTFTRKPGGAKK